MHMRRIMVSRVHPNIKAMLTPVQNSDHRNSRLQYMHWEGKLSKLPYAGSNRHQVAVQAQPTHGNRARHD